MRHKKDWKSEGPFEWRIFWRAFRRGAAETPRLYFEPLTLAFWRRIVRRSRCQETTTIAAATVNGEFVLTPGVWSVGLGGIILDGNAKLSGCLPVPKW